MMLPFGELLQFGELGAVVLGADEHGEEVGGAGRGAGVAGGDAR